MKRKKIVDDQVSIDDMMCDLAQCLVSDFQTNLGDASLFADFQSALRSKDAIRIRQATPTPLYDMDPPMFKATYQLQNVLKRYRFQKDLYTEDELREKAINTFFDTQSRISKIEFLDKHCMSVVRFARKYISRILGPYDEKEHRLRCRFGRRASVGIPARLACEAARWELPISGSQNQIAWFDAEMRHLQVVQEYWATQRAMSLDGVSKSDVYQVVETLKLTFVPKTHKSLRTIVPNTTIGSYMSYGLGEMIRARLKRNGYNIKTLQMKHRLLAQEGSFFGHLVTADLSSASDSISDTLVASLFPSDWFEVLELSRIGKISLPGVEHPIAVSTYATMGIGYTFPLQTLVFLALIKGIEHVFDMYLIPGVVSVYGDDLIYPVSYHKFVMHTFEKLGFVLNKEKSFSDVAFRESCGGDYYRGVDVRPFQPEGGSSRIRTGKQFEALLYKMINGLLYRWSEQEVGTTLNYLVRRLEENRSLIKLVPWDFPDEAGIKCSGIAAPEFLRGARCANRKHVGHGLYRFPFLTFKVKTRKEVRHRPYYWLALRDRLDQVFDYSNPMQLRQFSHPTLQLIEEITGVTKPLPILLEKEAGTQHAFPRGGKVHRQRCETHVTVSGTGHYTCQHGYSCFENRRTA